MSKRGENLLEQIYAYFYPFANLNAKPNSNNQYLVIIGYPNSYAMYLCKDVLAFCIDVVLPTKAKTAQVWKPTLLLNNCSFYMKKISSSDDKKSDIHKLPAQELDLSIWAEAEKTIGFDKLHDVVFGFNEHATNNVQEMLANTYYRPTMFFNASQCGEVISLIERFLLRYCQKWDLKFI